MRFSLRTKVVLSASTAGFLLAGLVFAALTSIHSIETESDRLDQAHRIQTKFWTLRSFLAQTIASQRGYLLSGDAGYLARYYDRRAKFDMELKRFRALTHENLVQHQRIDLLHATLQEKFDSLDSAITSFKTRSQELKIPTGLLPSFDNDLDAQLQSILEQMERAESQELELRSFQRDLTKEQVAILRILTIVGGSIIFGLAVLFLVAEFRKSQLAEQLQATATLQAAIIESSNDAIISKTLEGMITGWNAAAERIFGYQAHEAVGHKISELVFPKSQVDEEDFLLAKIRNGELVKNYDTIRKCKSGRLINVSVSLSPIRNSRGKIVGVSSIKRDITEQKRAEVNAIRFTEELQASNRDLEQFAFIASHDLQEPLRAVSGCVQLLQKRYAGAIDERADSYIQHIISGTQRMQRMIEDLLEFARLSRDKTSFEWFETKTVVDDAMSLLRQAIAKSGTVIDANDLPLLYGNAAQFVQFFQNMIGNAIKFCPPERKPQIRIGAVANAAGWVITVTDNGIGIKPEYAERIFGLFQRLHTREQYEGTGIGLALCKRIIEIHQGTIELNARHEGEGAEFVFFVPTNVPQEERRTADDAIV